MPGGCGELCPTKGARGSPRGGHGPVGTPEAQEVLPPLSISSFRLWFCCPHQSAGLGSGLPLPVGMWPCRVGGEGPDPGVTPQGPSGAALGGSVCPQSVCGAMGLWCGQASPGAGGSLFTPEWGFNLHSQSPMPRNEVCSPNSGGTTAIINICVV